jgi:hypothetical protein
MIFQSWTEIALTRLKVLQFRGFLCGILYEGSPQFPFFSRGFRHRNAPRCLNACLGRRSMRAGPWGTEGPRRTSWTVRLQAVRPPHSLDPVRRRTWQVQVRARSLGSVVCGRWSCQALGRPGLRSCALAVGARYESWASIGRRIAWAQEDPPPLIAGGNEDEHFETAGGVPRWRGGLREHQLSPFPQVFRAWRWVASGPADG